MKKEFLGTKCCVSKNWTEIKNVNYRDETLFYFMTKTYKYLSVYTIQSLVKKDARLSEGLRKDLCAVLTFGEIDSGLKPSVG